MSGFGSVAPSVASPRRYCVVAALLSLLLAPVHSLGQAPARTPQEVFDRAVADFENGHIAESVAAFDELVTLAPDVAPQLWQRGIALYYARRYRDCRLQFELHRTVNPNDVENAAWHFLCVARQESSEAARATLLPVGPDARVPMAQIYGMFRGETSPESVLAAAGDDALAQFYAHLYVGLYSEALGQSQQAVEHIGFAANPRFAKAGGYMYTVARVHSELLQRNPRR